MKNKLLLPVVISSVLGLSACGDSDDPAALVKAVKLESQRANGTVIESIVFEDENIRLRPKQTHQLVAIGTDSNGDERNVTEEVTWTSSNTDIATIDAKGVVTAVAALDENQGIVEFTATTINEVEAIAKLSISDSEATSLEVVLQDADGTSFTTCIDTQMAAKVTYQDGYVSAPDTNYLSWQLSGSTSASVNSSGVVFTSAEQSETLTIMATHEDGVSADGSFTASVALVDSVAVKLSEQAITSLPLALAQRETLVPEITLSNGETHTISNNAIWSSNNDAIAAVANQSGAKGNVVGLTAGEATFSAVCAGNTAEVVATVEGDSTLNGLKINDGEESLELEKGKKVSLQLFADLAGVSDDFNVSEFAQWTLTNSELATIQVIKPGTSEAYLELTASSSQSGSFTLISSYGGQSETLDITIPE